MNSVIRRVFALLALLFCCVFALVAQQSAPVTLPTLGLLGASFNQTASPRWNLLASAIYQQPGLGPSWYASTSIDAVPVRRIVSGKTIYSLSLSARQGLNYVLYRSDTDPFPRLTAFLGFDAGASFQQASPAGTNVNFAGATAGGLVGRLGSNTSRVGWFAIARAMYLPGDAGNLITPVGEIGIVYKFQ